MGTTTQDAPRLGRLHTARDLADQLGEDPQTIYRLARDHGLPCIRLGRAMRFDSTAVAAWLANGGTAGTGDAE
jgi:excisionase family DNA binding protein